MGDEERLTAEIASAVRFLRGERRVHEQRRSLVF